MMAAHTTICNSFYHQKRHPSLLNSTKYFFNNLHRLSTGASIQAQGTLSQSPGKEQATEMIIDNEKDVQIVGTCDATTYPLQKKRHTNEYFREIAHLRPRANTFSAMIRIRNAAAVAIHKYFQDDGFYWIHTPILTASDCEGAGEQFQVITTPEITKEMVAQEKTKPTETDLNKLSKTSFFGGSEAYLTVSGQLEAEIFACSMSKVYTFGPTFRAETSKTSRHLAEFWMVEMEQAFANLKLVMDHGEKMTKFAVKHVLETCPEELHFFNKWYDKELLARLEKTVMEPFERINYTDAVNILLKSGT